MSKPKYSPEFKIMVAEAYINGEGGFQCIANKYGVGVASVLLWVRCYNTPSRSFVRYSSTQTPFSSSCLNDE